jgi:tetratricopeptide (TPR) repeat protein
LNLRSAAAVIAMSGPEVLSGHYIHAMDYAIYAELQMGNVEAANKLLAEMERHTNHQNVFGTAYAAAAAPSRIPLEQGDWAAAANLPTTLHSAVSWERYPQTVAIRWFAIGLGAARSGDAAMAQKALSELASLRSVMEERDIKYWLALLSAQTGAIEAWLALSNGDTDFAIAAMQNAADMEDKVGKAPVTPGHVLPARELLGDLLLETGDKAGAAEAYKTALKTSPNRLRSLQGLALAQSN